MQIACGYGVVLYILAGAIAIGAIALYVIAVKVRHNTARDLAITIRDGKELFMRQVKTDSDYDTWLNNYKEWHKETKEVIEKRISQEAFIWFANISSGITISYKGSYGGGFGEHNSLLNELNSKLQKLGELLSRY
ncbi:hypothetical protein ES706_04286 [subsurface metagenome]